MNQFCHKLPEPGPVRMRVTDRLTYLYVHGSPEPFASFAATVKGCEIIHARTHAQVWCENHGYSLPEVAPVRESAHQSRRQRRAMVRLSRMVSRHCRAIRRGLTPRELPAAVYSMPGTREAIHLALCDRERLTVNLNQVPAGFYDVPEWAPQAEPVDHRNAYGLLWTLTVNSQPYTVNARSL